MNTPRDRFQNVTNARGGWRRDQQDDHLGPELARHSREQSRMEWRAAGAQFYPGGAYEQLQDLASHRGRGPKGYQRSDERLREIVCERLTDDPFVDARNVEVQVSNGEVTLQGTVENRQQKYAIEDLIADISGVIEIHNRLGVHESGIDERMSGL